jgi:hypothetical protein
MLGQKSARNQSMSGVLTYVITSDMSSVLTYVGTADASAQPMVLVLGLPTNIRAADGYAHANPSVGSSDFRWDC